MCVCAPLGHLILHSNLFKAKGIFYCALCFNFLARRCRNNGHHARSLLAFQLHCFLPHLFFCCHRVCMYVYPLFITLARTCTHTHTREKDWFCERKLPTRQNPAHVSHFIANFHCVMNIKKEVSKPNPKEKEFYMYA